MAEREADGQAAGRRTSGSPSGRPRRSGPRRSRPGSCRRTGCARAAAGWVVGSRPPGSASPVSTSASAPAISWPPNQRDEDRPRPVGPGHRHRRGGVDDDDRVRVGGEHGLDERVLVAGQVHVDAVLALGLPLVGRADDEHGGVARRGGGRGALDQVVGRRRAQADHGAVQRREGALARALDEQLDRLARRQRAPPPRSPR